MYIRIYGKYVYTPYSGSGIRIYSVYIYLVQFLKLVLILIQTSQLLPGQVLICMLQQVRLPLAGLFHLRVLPKALVNELLLGRHGAHCERRRRRASRQFSGGPQSGNSLLARQRGEPAPKRPPSPPPSMPPTTTNSTRYPYGYPDIRISAGSSSRSAGYANPDAGYRRRWGVVTDGAWWG